MPGRGEGSSRAMLATARPSCLYLLFRLRASRVLVGGTVRVLASGSMRVCVCWCSSGVRELFAERSRRGVPELSQSAGRRRRAGVRRQLGPSLHHRQTLRHHRAARRRRRLLRRLRVPTPTVRGRRS